MAAFKVLHTSDLHLGKRLFKTERYLEHEKFLEWILQEIIKRDIDIFLIAGDIFDVPSAPNQAQKIFYDFIYKLGQIPNLKTIVIGGNHDSNSLLQIPQNFFKDNNCYIHAGLFDDNNEHNLVFEKSGFKIGIKTLPYFRNFELLNKLNIQQAMDQDTQSEILENFFQHFFSQWPKNNVPDKKILLSHHGFGQYSAAGSEHAIYLSGLEYFPLNWVVPHFDYVALGHIHKRQTLSKDPAIIYPGSPIPLRFSEENQKYVSYIEIDNYLTKQEFIEIPQFRNLYQVQVTPENYKDEIKHLLAKQDKKALPCFLEIFMQLKEPQSGLADEIRKLLIKKNAQMLSFIPVIENIQTHSIRPDVSKLSIEEIFSSYYKLRYESEDVPAEILAGFSSLIEEIHHENS